MLAQHQIPYDPSKPIETDDRFFDQERAIEAVMHCLNRGTSCAVIGGAGMGKTSILKCMRRRLRRKLQPSPQSEFTLVPVYFKTDIGGAQSLRDIFFQIIDVAVSEAKEYLQECLSTDQDSSIKELDFKRWVDSLDTKVTPEEALKAFEADLWQIARAICHSIGNARLVFLLDELYCIIDKAVQSDLGWCLFRLLGDENPERVNLRALVSFVIACIREPMEQFTDLIQGIPPDQVRGCAYIEPIHLKVFVKEDALELIQVPMTKHPDLEITYETAEVIYTFTGGHPRLIHAFMHDLWFDSHSCNTDGISVYIQGYQEVFHKRQKTMYSWIADYIDSNVLIKPIFQILREMSPVQETQIRAVLGEAGIYGWSKFKLRDALTTLEYLGVVYKTEETSYSLSGEWVKNWFGPLESTRVNQDNYRVQIPKLESKLTRFLEELRRYEHVEGIRALEQQLRDELVSLRTDRDELLDLEQSGLLPDNPIRRDQFRRLIRDIQRISNYIHFDIEPLLHDLGVEIAEVPTI